MDLYKFVQPVHVTRITIYSLSNDIPCGTIQMVMEQQRSGQSLANNKCSVDSANSYDFTFTAQTGGKHCRLFGQYHIFTASIRFRRNQPFHCIHPGAFLCAIAILHVTIQLSFRNRHIVHPFSEYMDRLQIVNQKGDL